MFEPVPPSVCMHRRQQPVRERNFISAFMCFVFVIMIASALAQPHWFYLRGGGCTQRFIGVQEFFFIGNLEAVSPPSTFNRKNGPLIYSGFDEKMMECVTPEIIKVHKTIIFLCFMCIFCASTQLVMDIVGVKNRKVKCFRRNAFAIVFSAILTIIIIGLCFYASELIKAHQEKSKVIATTSVQVDFSTSYYLVIVASIVGIFASGANLLRRYPDDHINNGHILLDGPETFSIASPHSRSWARVQPILTPNDVPDAPPPPPYTP